MISDGFLVTRGLFTTDEAGNMPNLAVGRTMFYTTERLSQRQSMTPEGFLICFDVPIARTGEMIYGPDDGLPIDVGDDGVIHIVRDEEEVFRPEFIASFQGKPVVNEHPTGPVSPDDWISLATGVVLNPRRGQQNMSEFLLADLMIYKREEIEEVRSGKREVSCGYNADYEEIGKGRGKQKNMIGNHVALVNSGRCGPRCAIGDRKSILTGDSAMPAKKRVTVIDRIRAVLGQDAAKPAVKQVLDESVEELEELDAAPSEPSGESHIHVHASGGGGEQDTGSYDAMNERMTALETGHTGIMDALEEIRGRLPKADDAATPNEEVEGALQEEAPPGTTDSQVRLARDSSMLASSFQDTLSLAEILVPGIQVPVFDAAAVPSKTLDSLCKFRRTALDLAYVTPEGRAAIDEFHGKKPALDSMTCKDVRSLFRGAAAIRKAVNRSSSSTNDGTRRTDDKKPAPLTVAQLNAKNREFWSKQGQG